MKDFKTSTQYRKDLKRYKHKPQMLTALKEVLKMLRNEQPIPAKYKPHMLLGEYKDCMECLIEGDFLLIWVDETNNIIEFVRLGSHSELFGK
jgi:mRNA interferase YafQ